LERNRYDRGVLSIKSTDFRVGEMNWGSRPLSEESPTYTEIREVCQASANEGYFCHDEMFIFALELINRVPGIITALRDRFPILFVDEAQDNSEDQSAILHHIFMSGECSVLRQRFGDENQAIFDSNHSEEAFTDKFPSSTIRIELPNSHRFGQTIATFANAFEVVPCR